MFSLWTIKLLNVVFSASLGLVALRLCIGGFASDKVRKSSPLKRAEFFLRVSKNGSSYMNLVLEKSHYLIGRGPECDILLKGIGIPLNVGEIYLKDGEYIFRDFEENEEKISPGAELKLYDYCVKVERIQN